MKTITLKEVQFNLAQRENNPIIAISDYMINSGERLLNVTKLSDFYLSEKESDLVWLDVMKAWEDNEQTDNMIRMMLA